MTLTSNRSFLQKADLAIQDLTAGGAYLIPAQAKKFMRLLIKQSELLQMVTFVPMGAPKHQISKIKFGSRILFIAVLSHNSLFITKQIGPTQHTQQMCFYDHFLMYSFIN